MKSKNQNVVVVDLGSSKLACVVADINGDDIKLSGSRITNADGFKSGTIYDMKSAENTVLNSIYAMENVCGKNIQKVNVILSGSGAKSAYIEQSIKISDAHVTKNDVSKLILKSIDEFKDLHNQIIHYFPIEFSVDRQGAISDPIGMLGKELSCKLHIVTISKTALDNVVACLGKCQLSIDNIVLGVYASALACLNSDEKKLGSLTIDIGARTTSFCIFLDNKLVYAGYVPVGSAHISSDIAKAFSISMETAEKLKVLYGKAIYPNTNEIIELNDSDLENQQIFEQDLLSVVIPRVEEIFEMIKAEYENLGFDHLISRKIVITGGGANLMHLSDYVQKLFNKQTRLGVPDIPDNFNEPHNILSYAAAFGCLKYIALDAKNTYNAMHDTQQRSVFGKIAHWIKENI